MVFRFDLIFAVEDECLQVERSVERAVADAACLHGLAAHLVVGEEHTVPCKHRVALQLQVFHDVAKRIHIVLAASARLLLSCLQIVEHRCIGSELCIDGKRLDEHAHGVSQLLGLAPVVNGVEECFLVVVELGQQVSVGHGEQRALEDAVVAAELLHAVHVDGKGAKQAGFLQFGFFAVGQQLGESVAAVKILGIPLLGLFECRRLAQGFFLGTHIGQRHALSADGLSVVGIVDVVEQQAHGSSVDDEVMIVDEEVEVVVVSQEVDAEQPVVVDVERPYQFGSLLLDICGVFYFQFEMFVVHVDGLHGFTVVGEFDACEQGGVGLHGVDDGCAQPLFVERLVERIYIRKVIAYFTNTAGAFHVDAVLNL